MPTPTVTAAANPAARPTTTTSFAASATSSAPSAATSTSVSSIAPRIGHTAFECADCGRRASLERCARCLGAWYCGGECQRRDWATHKLACKKLAPAPSAAEAAAACSLLDGARLLEPASEKSEQEMTVLLFRAVLAAASRPPPVSSLLKTLILRLLKNGASITSVTIDNVVTFNEETVVKCAGNSALVSASQASPNSVELLKLLFSPLARGFEAGWGANAWARLTCVTYKPDVDEIHTAIGAALDTIVSMAEKVPNLPAFELLLKRGKGVAANSPCYKGTINSEGRALGGGDTISTAHTLELLWPLHLAAQKHCLRAVELLLSAGADPNARTVPSCWSALEIVLAEAGSRRHSGKTRIFSADFMAQEYAEDRERERIALMLLKAGADPTCRRRDGRGSAVHFAGRWGNAYIFKELLLRGSDPVPRPVGSLAFNYDDDGIWTETIGSVHYLQLAAERGHDDVIRIMLDAGVPVDFRDVDQFKRTPLLNALYFRCESTARLLLERGADVNALYRYTRFENIEQGGVTAEQTLMRVAAKGVKSHFVEDCSPLDCAKRLPREVNGKQLSDELIADLIARGAKPAKELGGIHNVGFEVGQLFELLGKLHALNTNV